MNHSLDLLDSGLLEQVAKIVSAYVANNPVSPADLPTLIANTHSAMRALSSAQTDAPVELPSPAVSIKKSVMPDFIICLEDGKKFKSMKRHLAWLGMTPDDYRAKWSLPSDYPTRSKNAFSANSAATEKR
ncbi:hypothetical protein WH91_06820 [Devosia psychrophila]|uniref:Transcriptional regulator, MucR family n=1 Tax=Devosia psychrophila TaxID=728005 RepID=A0ABR5E0A0_9HYPH|nr:MucR family transcriptional regulator [Devosia psychrophila]KKC33748.1 hypothetical protein WH91_06820 [Devosia psychrophila]